MKNIQLGSSDLHVKPICLGTMTFGAQVDEATSHNILARSLDAGIDFMDTAEMYAVPPRPETYNKTETFIGNYFAKNKGVRDKWTVATKVAGPSRGMDWIRGGAINNNGQTIIEACEASLKRLNVDVIDLYQLHWPNRHVPQFGMMYYNPKMENLESSGIHEQLEAFSKLVKAGKIRAIGLSNETPYGVHEFVRLAEQHGLPRIASVQNAYCLVNRTVENALDETMHRLNVGLLAYSPLAFGLLTGKYDDLGIDPAAGAVEATGRLSLFASMRAQRWGRPEALHAAKRYNQLARDNGMTPTQLALAFCYQKWQVASTIIGVTSVAQFDECLKAWDTPPLSKDLLKAIDQIRWEERDPAL
jgi:aryl-alcohol dehydrogenase-like predicted oxidoreductase